MEQYFAPYFPRFPVSQTSDDIDASKNKYAIPEMASAHRLAMVDERVQSIGALLNKSQYKFFTLLDDLIHASPIGQLKQEARLVGNQRFSGTYFKNEGLCECARPNSCGLSSSTSKSMRGSIT